MKVHSAALSRGLRAVSQAVSGSEILPILSAVLFEAKEDRLRLTGGDLEVFVSCDIPLSECVPGGFVLKHETIAEVVTSIQAGDVVLSPSKGKVLIENGSSKFNLNALEVPDYPKVPVVPDGMPSFSLPTSELERVLGLLDGVAMNAKETSRLNLTGINIKVSGQALRFCATNGYRAGIVDLSLPAPVEKPINVVVSADSFSVLAQGIKGFEAESVDFYCSASEVFFLMPGFRFVSRKMDEDYPDIQRVFPEESDLKIVVDRKSLLAGINRVAFLADKASGSVGIEVDAGGLLLSTQDSEFGAGKDRLSLDKPCAPCKVRYRAEYVSSALKRMQSEIVTLSVNPKERAGKLTGEKDSGFTYLVMPIRE